MKGPWWVAPGLALGSAGSRLLAGWVTQGAALLGLLLAAGFYLFGGWPLLLSLALLVVVGSAATKLGSSQKERLGGGAWGEAPRGVSQVLANGGPAALFLLLSGVVPGALIGAHGALGAALSDTLAGELGMLLDTRPRLLLLGALVPPGSNGGMSWWGSLVGILGAAMIPAAALLFWPGSGLPFWPLLLGGVAGGFLDSLLGAFLEPHLMSRYANDLVNALASTCGGLLACLLA